MAAVQKFLKADDKRLIKGVAAGEKALEATHVLMDGGRGLKVFTGKIALTHKERDQLYRSMAIDFEAHGKKYPLVERVPKKFRFCLDWDLKTPAVLDAEQKGAYERTAMRAIATFVDAQPDQPVFSDDEEYEIWKDPLTCVVCDPVGPPRKCTKDDVELIKDGVHMVYPNLVVNIAQAQHIVAEVVVPALAAAHAEIDWTTAIDSSIFRGSLRMCYTTKRECCSSCQTLERDYNNRRRACRSCVDSRYGQDCDGCKPETRRNTDCEKCQGNVVCTNSTDHYYAPSAVYSGDICPYPTAVDELKNDPFKALQVTAVTPPCSTVQITHAFKPPSAPETNKRKAENNERVSTKKARSDEPADKTAPMDVEQTFGPAFTHFTPMSFEEIKEIYLAAGGTHELQEFTGSQLHQYREISPGPDARRCLAEGCPVHNRGGGHSDNALLQETSKGLLYTCLSTNTKHYIWTRKNCDLLQTYIGVTCWKLLEYVPHLAEDKVSLRSLGRTLKQLHQDISRSGNIREEIKPDALGDILRLWNLFTSSHEDRSEIWDDIRVSESKDVADLLPSALSGEVFNLVVDEKLRSDLQFDTEFVDFACKRFVVEAAAKLDEAKKAYNDLKWRLDDGELSPEAEEQLLVNLKLFLDANMAHKNCEELLMQYVGNFHAKVVSNAKTEIVQCVWRPLKERGETRYVLDQAFPRLKHQFLDANSTIAALVTTWMAKTNAYSGFRMDPRFSQARGDKPKGLATFNLFCGFAIDSQISPDAAKVFKYDQEIVDRVNEHLLYMLNGDTGLFWWVVRWIAYPLQNRGERTGSWIIHRSDKKGIGKGLFWNEFIGNLLYGGLDETKEHKQSAYDQIKDIDYIVGDFNSGLLNIFMNLDECGIFDGATKQNEKVKGLVTERTVQVNRKHLAVLTLRNVINSVLTTNKPEPIFFEPGDRRFALIESEHKRSLDFFRKDGFAAFITNPNTALHYYCYLMQLDDMQKFKDMDPPVNDSKRQIMLKNAAPEAKFMQAFCIRMRQLPFDQYTRCADESILTEGTLINRQLLGDAFDHYVKENHLAGKKRVTRETLFSYIKNTFKTSSHSPVYFSGLGTSRPIVLPSLPDIISKMRENDSWDDEFRLDMTSTIQSSALQLYCGAGIKSLNPNSVQTVAVQAVAVQAVAVQEAVQHPEAVVDPSVPWPVVTDEMREALRVKTLEHWNRINTAFEARRGGDKQLDSEAVQAE
jgi:hypothetical protein